MQNLSNADIEQLLEKYLEGKTTLEEEAMLSSYFSFTNNLSPEESAFAAEFRFYKQLQKANHDPGLYARKLLPQIQTKNKTGKTSFLYYSNRVAASLILIIAGYCIGKVDTRKQKENDKLGLQLLGMKQEMYSLKKMISERLLEDEWTHKKVKAIFIAGQLDTIDEELVKTIVHTINTDESINVRLTAVDLLMRNYTNDFVRPELLPALINQDEWYVQLKILDIIGKLNDPGINSDLQHLLKDPRIHQNLKIEIRKILTPGTFL